MRRSLPILQQSVKGDSIGHTWDRVMKKKPPKSKKFIETRYLIGYHEGRI